MKKNFPPRPPSARPLPVPHRHLPAAGVALPAQPLHAAAGEAAEGCGGRRRRRRCPPVSGDRPEGPPQSRPLPAAAARTVPPPPARTWVGAGGHMTRCATIG